MRTRRCAASMPSANAPAACTARRASAATRCRSCWSSASAPAGTRRSMPPAPARCAAKRARRRRKAAASSVYLTAIATAHVRPSSSSSSSAPWTCMSAWCATSRAWARRSPRWRRWRPTCCRRWRSRPTTASATMTGSRRWRCRRCCGSAARSPARLRNESRGAHYREDCPDPDDSTWRRNILIRSDGDDLAFRTQPAAPEHREFEKVA